MMFIPHYKRINQSSLSLLATDILILPIHNLYPRLPNLGRVDNRLHQLRFQMLGLAIDLPKFLLHQLDLYLVLSGVIEEVVAELNADDEAYEA